MLHNVHAKFITDALLFNFNDALSGASTQMGLDLGTHDSCHARWHRVRFASSAPCACARAMRLWPKRSQAAAALVYSARESSALSMCRAPLITSRLLAPLIWPIDGPDCSESKHRVRTGPCRVAANLANI